MHITDLEYKEKIEAQIVELAASMIKGEIGIIDGSRQMVPLCHSIGEECEPDFNEFIYIDSETDHLPVGKVRKFWASDSLIKKDEQIKKAEDIYREGALNACRSLIRRFQRDKE
jgi:hypothetical protein